MLFPLLGDLVLVLRLDIVPLLGKTRSVGLTFCWLVTPPLGWLRSSSLDDSVTLALQFRLSLRLSLIPLALLFRTAGLLASAPVEESRRACGDWC